jgi:hypothetical protein
LVTIGGPDVLTGQGVPTVPKADEPFFDVDAGVAVA